MPTTVNYNWPTPADTDLVKNGADAIRDLGDAADTTVKSVADGRGLIHINTTSFSAVASQAVNTVFSSTYANYLIRIHLTACTGDGQIYVKLRNGITDKSANYSTSSDTINSSATRNTFTNTGGNGFMIGETDAGSSNNYYSWNFNLYTPFTTTATTGQVQGSWYSTAGEWRGNYGGYLHNENYSADGINVIASSGNITGVISVYGYK